jgi:Trk K+ transport system NAD-binding subunit
LPFLILLLTTVLLLSSVAYMAGMHIFEGKERTFWQAFEWAAETISSTGYGNDGNWEHPLMVLYVVLIQFMGAFLLFLILPAYLIPMLEDRFEARLPLEAGDLKDHVVVYRHSSMIAALLAELKEFGREMVVIEPDEAIARRYFDNGGRVVLGEEDGFSFERANLSRAAFLVLGGSDDDNAAAALAARQSGFDKEIYAVIDERRHREALLLAGVTDALVPRELLGIALAARASRKISPTLDGLQKLGDQLQVAEMRLARDSPIAGLTLREADLGRRAGVHVVAQWVDGGFEVLRAADDRLRPEAVLVAVGGSQHIGELERICEGAVKLRRTGHFIVAGYGEVGRRVAAELRAAGESVKTLDRLEVEGVDFVTDMLEPESLVMADGENAQAVVLALDTDAVNLFATVLIKDQYPDLPVIARVTQPRNVGRMYQAGAEFALSVGAVAAQMLVRRMQGEETLALGTDMVIKRIEVDRLAGRRLGDLGLRSRTGASIVAVERPRVNEAGSDVVLDLGGGFTFEPGDSIFVIGDTRAVHEVSGLA